MTDRILSARRAARSFARRRRAQHGMQPYWVSIFLGAFLLFSVQLLLGKYFLPWFGGTPAMWTTCMFFFQTLLLAGYAYAHALANWFTSPDAGLPAFRSPVHQRWSCLRFLAVMWGTPITPECELEAARAVIIRYGV